MKKQNMKWSIAGVVSAAAVVLGCMTGFAGEGGLVIGFSNSYNGNSFRQCEEKAFIEVADQLVADGVIAEYKIVESNQNNQLQVSQIQDLILEGVDAIIVDPGSPTALSSAIDQAEDAGIPLIIVNGGPVENENCYQVVFDQRAVTRAATRWVAEQMGGKGNVLLIRGISGVQADIEYYDGMTQVLAEYPDINIVGEVYGEWTNSVAQTAVAQVLPSLPEVDGVIGEGGDAIGAIEAFKAAGRDIPIVYGGNRGIFLNWWNEQPQENPDFECYSICVDPAVASAGLFLAVDIVNGEDVPKNMVYENLEITQENLQSFIDQGMEDADVAMSYPTWDWVRETLESQESATLPLS